MFDKPERHYFPSTPEEFFERLYFERSETNLPNVPVKTSNKATISNPQFYSTDKKTGRSTRKLIPEVLVLIKLNLVSSAIHVIGE